MDQSQLEMVMMFQLENISRTEEELTPDSIHEDYLKPTARGKIDPARVYQDLIGWTFDANNVEEKEWPADWKKLSIRDLASKLLMIVFILLLPFLSKSQLQVTVGATNTDLREAAVTIGISYFKAFDSIWKQNNRRWYGKNSTFSINPELHMLTGTEDAFSSITMKATGLLMKFKTTTVAGLLTPNTNTLFHTFPMSLGIETNNMFSSVNAIVEGGWVPWYQANGVNLPKILKSTTVGVFLQAGYKMYVDSSGRIPVGGDKDESQELPDKFLARVKGSFDVDTKTILKVSGLDVGIVGGADVWFDVVNGATYYRLEGRGRFYIDKLRYVDVIYQKGSGAPNFNQGDQYGVGLTITF